MADEKLKAEICMDYLEQILAGAKEIAPVEDGEIEKLLQLVKTVIENDFSVRSKVKEDLGKRLLELVRKKDKLGEAMLAINDGALDEEDLDHVVAAGSLGHGICPHCGAMFQLSNGICDCSYKKK